MVKKLIALFFMALILGACGANRVLVKHSSCQPEPGQADTDNCQKIRDL